MPRPVESQQRYVPGLDGIRAIAVLCVLAYHLGFGWARGGMLGVGVFFTLSGYLITDLLLEHWRRYGRLGLGQFWLRRARRLLPALFVLLVAVSIWVALFDAGQLAAVRRQAIAAALYFGNWSTIAAHGSYFTRFAAPLPLDHLWSLAIEEQFYLVWPWLLLLGIYLARSRRVLAVLTLAGAAASAYLMAKQYHPGYDPTRAYEGTDTRAFGLLIGAALAMLWPMNVPRRRARGGAPTRRRSLLDSAGVIGLGAIFLLVWRTDSFSSFLYPDGFLLLSIATAAVIMAVVNPGSALDGVLGCTPLRWIGVRSYGIYLWQWPIVVLASPSSSAVRWPRAAFEVAGTLLAAALSWRLIEEPIRRGALGRLWRQARFPRRRARARRRALALGSTSLATLVIAVAGLAGALPASSAGQRPVAAGAATAPLTSLSGAVLPPVPALSRVQLALASVSDRFAGIDPPRRGYPNRTSCRSVVYIGDSTSEGETSPNYIPNPGLRLPAQLARVGVKVSYPEISGARSIVETYQGNANAAAVARQYVAAGFRGCWILALGTNDVADLAVGSNVALQPRIDTMMRVIGNHPTLWVAATTLVQSGPYAADGMQRWNQDLLSSCVRYPDLRVFDWARHAKRRWFIPDGIHYYSPGYVARAHFISRALADAFPANQPPSASCLIP